MLKKFSTKALSLAGIGGIIVISALSLYQWISMQAEVSHTLTVQSEFNKCLSSIFEVEEARRGYVLKGEDQYFERYSLAKQKVDKIIDSLVVLTSDNQVQQVRLKDLRKDVHDLNSHLDQIIQSRKEGGFEAAVAAARKTNAGAAITDAIRAQISAALNHEAELLRLRADRAFFWQCVGLTGVGILSLISIISFSYLLRLVDREKFAERMIREQEMAVESFMHEQTIAKQREDFMAALAHNLQIPMIGAQHIYKGFLLGRIGELNPQQKDIVKSLANANDTQIALINRLLDVYKYQEKSSQDARSMVEISEIIDECLVGFKQRAADAMVDLSCTSTSMEFNCDRDAIIVLLTNYIDNAIKFTKENGHITVDAYSSDNNLIIEVKDTGCGFDQEHQAVMFETVWKGPSGRAPKIGLGLYLCKQIAEFHGGSVSCKSEVGKGSIFYATFPL